LWLLGKLLETETCENGATLARIDFLGEADDTADGTLGNFRRGISRLPRNGDEVAAVTHADMVGLFGAGDRAHIEIGTIYPTSDVRASLYIDPLLGRHFALVGSTGSGKSTAMALILHRIIGEAPHGHIVVLDPHGEYGAAFPETGKVFNVDNLDLPYWLMNFEEHCEVFIASEGSERDLDKALLASCLLTARSRNSLAAAVPNLTVDSPVPYMLAELVGALQTQLGKLDNSGEVARYVRLKNRIEQVLRDSRYAFMFRRELSVDTMKQFLARILRLPGEGRPVSIIDLSGVPSDIMSVVVALLSRIVMDYAIWSRSERQRPILLVCEEAHHYVPSERKSHELASRKILERIAKEGRKYGVALALVTQRPSDLAEGALSQCGTILAMRLNNERDQACVRNAMPEGGRAFLDSIPALRRGECIICGEGVAIPLQVRIDEVEARMRPRSDDPVYSESWRQTDDETGTLDRTIERWRSQSDRPGSDRPNGDAISSLLRRPLNAMSG
jgi:DNA helicase HerA-like ATPase